MPSGKNWINFIYINLAFALYIIGVFYYSQLAEIKANWPLYRCNPMYMPLADDINENFIFCVQSMQIDFMGYLLQPITFITSAITSMLGNFLDTIQNVRAMFNKIRTFFTNIIQSIFGVFLNLIIEFQRIIIGIKDLIGKTIGIMVSLMYTMDGSIKTMRSVWNGPPGQMVRALGRCFYPNTFILLKNGEKKYMKDLDLGDVLSDGSIVESVMKIDNKREPIPFYVIKGGGVEGNDIYVTGSHLVFNKTINKFIKVEDYSNAVKSDFKTDWFSCLITSNHKIPIGNEIFWDWEDHFIKMKMV
uniref:Hint domain-containing protein n=1 Tax=viral metagenome TaxID=1070528 RepID=A0A6C0AQK2_9ZZZZ